MSTFKKLQRSIREIYRITRLATGGPGWAKGAGLYIFILAASLTQIYISTLFIDWNKDFYDALQSVDIAETLKQTWVFLALTAVSAGLYLCSEYVRKIVLILWRQRLNDVVVDAWLGDKTYWHLQPGMTDPGIDNPDQRIAEDCQQFIKRLLEHTVDLVTRVVGLFTYLTILWSLASFTLRFSLLGADIAIPYYLVWLAFIYVFGSSLLTHWLGAPLKGLLFTQQKREADYRFSLTRIRDWSDSIAMSSGEAAERRLLDQRFDGIVTNWRKVVKREFILGCFRRPYFQTVLQVPLFFALPIYLAGGVTFGGLMQVRSAFSRVVNSLSWFIFEYPNLADWVATTNRLTGFLDTAERVKTNKTGIVTVETEQDALVVEGLHITTPEGKRLALPSDFSIRKGEHIWLKGPSGSGKTTLLKALAGLWTFGEGKISKPANWSAFFVSQDPYFPLSGLLGAATYPGRPDQVDMQEIASGMQSVGLAHRSHGLEQETDDVVGGLSGGEKQRLVFLRMLIARPDWIFLDEATSALDREAEAELIDLLVRYLPNATIVFVSHRPPPHGSGWRAFDVGKSNTISRLEENNE
ncbi:ABC transporter ATP-binding protein/permease [Cohaesibacter haloalkalitolerans]|uniref:ABC transporter ATP-binding protein/permease n=1 Tax=Cohaesibacter haloalkalitolerans TaxID=1162980 RepID=UPI0013C52407|nr:ABC transporter ATP-binding protein/permease [Cohaesibacter haloalkalitolerans]